MAKGYRPVDRDQAFLFPPDMREWLPAGPPVWLGITAGGGRLGTVARDGRKTAASASKAATRAEEGLRKLAREAVAGRAAADAAEDALFGPGVRGDEVPEEAWSPRGRAGRIAAALADLEAERRAAEQEQAAKAEEFRARQRSGQRTGCSPDSAAVALAQEKLARVMAAQQAKIDQWDARNAASLAATGKPLRHPPRRLVGRLRTF